jgi:hypothetical protein
MFLFHLIPDSLFGDLYGAIYINENIKNLKKYKIENMKLPSVGCE